MPATLGLVAVGGASAALVGTYWDDSWHTDRGRDGVAIAPHLVLYAGVAVAALSVLVWGIRELRAGPRRALRDPALLLAGLGGAATLLAAPVDNAWHVAYGRDAVLWSPPHLLALVGTLALSVGLLAGLRDAPGRTGALARLGAGAGVLGTLQVLVLEYDSDVPQFPVILFLPVAALAVCLAAALLEDLTRGRWAPVWAAALYTVLRAGTVALLAGLGFSLTAVPPVLVVLLVFAALARLALAARLVLLGALAPLAWWPVLALQSSVAATVPAGALAAAVGLGALAGLGVALLHGDLTMARGRRPVAALATALGVLGLLGGPAATPARAHDPGQGRPLLAGTVTVDRSGRTAVLTVQLATPCAGLRADRTLARRAGRLRTGPLSATETAGGCRLAGTVSGLSPGRWFVYAQATDPAGRPVEVWLPAGTTERISADRDLYVRPAAPDRGTQTVLGAGLLAIVAGLLTACLRLARRVATSV